MGLFSVRLSCPALKQHLPKSRRDLSRELFSLCDSDKAAQKVASGRSSGKMIIKIL
jgi:hypothetical protein